MLILFAGGGAAKAEVEKLVKVKGLLNVTLIPRLQKELMCSGIVNLAI